MNILVRLPNWLGDMVMSTAFIRSVKLVYPEANIDVIAKKGLIQLMEFIPGTRNTYSFSRDEWPGLKGAYAFGKKLGEEQQYDKFFCLPDSLSSAVMAFATGSRERIGFKKEGRGIFLTKRYTRPKGIHRAEEYISLLQQYLGKEVPQPGVNLISKASRLKGRIIININSEAISRRMPVAKSISLLNLLMQQVPAEYLFIGGPNELSHVEAIIAGLHAKENIINMAGKTNLQALCDTIATGSLMLSTDSGPAHLANAFGVYTIVLMGAGDETNTAPYDANHRTIIRLGQLECEPCVKNTCKFGLPKCLELLDEQKIVNAVKAIVHGP